MEDKSMTLTEHLEELRRVLLVCLVALGISTIITYFGFRNQLLALLTQPVKDLGVSLVYITPWEAFFTSIKASILAAVFLALPVILWQIWSFILPALHRHERRLVFIIMPFSLLLFFGGIAFGYFVVLPAALRFLLVTASEGFQPLITISRYIGFLVTFVLPFGLVFQLPLVVVLLTRLGLISPQFLARNRKLALLIIFLLAALLTPTPDVVSQLLMGLPMVGLYESSIWLSFLVRRRQEKAESEGI
ncbi:twin-arginine translocase subunit TatC [Thermanaeromonas sp. C210]|uniref:twin-arginine translocase subunit TatC n=1 Tax=Thermanaeromonas sp. C210 TaxID=2731925 RepID=UPI00155D0D0E|nr:twin-arginine translocase subunit TatC [Thermanaeromonas sp. C210]GFN23563.1 Sec-independent protein translocase protein TatC [Thermanaeromonas sp. C210]